jgi:hypothetical protein
MIIAASAHSAMMPAPGLVDSPQLHRSETVRGNGASVSRCAICFGESFMSNVCLT